MDYVDHAVSANEWAEMHFDGVDLFDVRREQRLKTIAAAMAANPGATIPQLFTRRYDTKAAYTFFGRPEATPDAIQATHRELTLQRAAQAGTALLIEDTTTLDFTDRDEIDGLGPIGNSNDITQGFFLHSVLAVAWPGLTAEGQGRRPAVEVLGLAWQQSVVRTPRPESEGANNAQRRLYRARESGRWSESVGQVGPSPEGVRWVHVADREADIYEALAEYAGNGHGHVIRAAQNRALVEAAGPLASTSLFEVARCAPALGNTEVPIARRGTRRARSAKVKLSAAQVRIRSPWRPGHAIGTLEPIACSVVRVWEPDPPEGAEAVEWILLVDGVAETFEQAHERAQQYATRWIGEDYHRALKSGVKVEQLQLETAERLCAAIAILSVVALRLVGLRERMRTVPDLPAERAGLDPLELEVLRTISRGRLKTVRDVGLALGRQGGHLNRKQDGLPGWESLWRGLQKVSLLAEGVRLAKKVKRFGE